MAGTISILGEQIEINHDRMPIDQLRFLQDNPRVYAVTHGSVEGFAHLTVEEQQQLIFEKLSEEPSVQNLLPEVRRHGGLLEPIVVRLDTREVIEGNSRLAVYRLLRKREADGPWNRIPCHIISSLTEEHQAAYLNQIHVKGKTSWSAYEKANFAFVRHDHGWSHSDIASLFGESVGTIRTRVAVVSLMRESEDDDRRRFSYYDVLVRTPKIWQAVRNDGSVLRENVIGRIKELDPSREQDFTAQDLRKKLPVIIAKPKVLRRYVKGEVDLDEGYQRARVSLAQQRVTTASAQLEAIEKSEVVTLDQNSLNALKQALRKLERSLKRIHGLVERRGGRGQ